MRFPFRIERAPDPACPDVVPPPLPPSTAGYDAASDWQPWVGLPDAGWWQPLTQRSGPTSLADEIADAHDRQTAGITDGGYVDPRPDDDVATWVQP